MLELNTAAFHYRTVFREGGGPIERLVVFPQGGSLNLGFLSANAYLLPSLRPEWVPHPQVYEPCDGSGTHKLQSMACFIAISEALDRWAFYSECEGPRRAEFGFDIEPSTTGLAAFPAITGAPARRRASSEAVERWSLVEWWLGHLPNKEVTDRSALEYIVEIVQPFREIHVVICRITTALGSRAYGFAGGRSQLEALARARIECQRNQKVLDNLLKKGPSSPDQLNVLDFTNDDERRLLFFASTHGAHMFQERVDASLHMTPSVQHPAKLVDSELKGPWSRWAKVWRVLYAQSSYEHLDSRKHDFFLF